MATVLIAGHTINNDTHFWSLKKLMLLSNKIPAAHAIVRDCELLSSPEHLRSFIVLYNRSYIQGAKTK